LITAIVLFYFILYRDNVHESVTVDNSDIAICQRNLFLFSLKWYYVYFLSLKWFLFVLWLQQKVPAPEPTHKNMLFYSNELRSQPDGKQFLLLCAAL